MTLVEFLEARYVEVEQEAVRGYYSDTHWRLFTTTAHLKAWVAWRGYFPREQWDATANDAVTDAAVAGIRERITAHEADRTARVLREVESKRQLIKEHAADYGDCRVCARVTAETITVLGDAHYEALPHPCRTLRILALPFADHPEYNESWRP